MIIPARKIAKRLTTNVKGFTLIELLIVIAILGILAAAVLIAVNPGKRQNQAKDANIKNDIGSIATALQAYYTAPGSGTYPLTLQTLVDNQDLKQLPTPPTGGSGGGSYVYDVSGSVGSDTLCDNAVGGTPCIEAYLQYVLFDPTPAGSGNVWCWESVEGRAEEETLVNCTDYNSTT